MPFRIFKIRGKTVKTQAPLNNRKTADLQKIIIVRQTRPTTQHYYVQETIEQKQRRLLA